MRFERETTYSFFCFVQDKLGSKLCLSMKEWININHKIIKNLSKLQLLYDCKKLNLFPPHIVNNLKLQYIKFLNNKFTQKFIVYKNIFIKKIINLEIRDAQWALHSLRYKLFKLTSFLSKSLPCYFWNKFFDTQKIALDRFAEREFTKVENKVYWLAKKRDRAMMDKLPTVSYCVHEVSTQVLDQTHIESLRSGNSDVAKPTYNYSIDEPLDNSSLINKIEIKPNEFLDIVDTVKPLKEKWFVNLSSGIVPDDVIDVLSLGEKFSLPSNLTKKNVTLEFVKDIENNIKYCEDVVKSTTRLQSVPSLERFVNEKQFLNKIESNLIYKEKVTSSFIKEHPNLIFTKADKGNVTVALDRSDYIEKVESMLKDTSTYTVIESNPVRKIESKLRDCLKSWLNAKFITNKTYYFLLSNDKVLPRAYGLPKIHKPGNPFRIIVSCIDTTLFKFASFLHSILYEHLPKARSFIKNSYDLCQRLSGLKINDSDILLSLDVVSLFTNIPLDFALDAVRRRWDHIEKHTVIPIESFTIALEFILSSTYFTFNGVIYKQTFGTPMGSPLSPIIADLVMQDLEEHCLNCLSLSLPVYYRYVDDILLLAPKESVGIITEAFNSYHTRLKFTCEIESNRSINFLDVTISAVNGTLELNWYRKPTFSGRYLNFFSQHPLRQKIGVIFSVIDKAILLSHPKFQENNLRLAIEILMANDYPLDLIFKQFKRRLHVLFNSKLNGNSETASTSNDNKSAVEERFFVLPFVPGVSRDIVNSLRNSNSLKNSNFKFAFRSINKLSRFIKVHKDKLESSSKSDVIYKINCASCDSSYVGQTSRRLLTRITEHQRNIYAATARLSVVSRHRIDFGHDFLWNEAKILDSERYYHKRLISEMLHIKMQNKGINLKKDTELLDPIYLPLIDKINN